MKQTAEEAARENILFNHRTVDRTLFGKDLAKFGEMNFVQGAEWQSKQSPVAIIRWFRDMYCGSLSCICVSICLWICPILIWIQDLRRIDNEVSESI